MTNATRWAVEISRGLERLDIEIGKNAISYTNVVQALEGIRLHAAAALLRDFNDALKERVEDQLWDAHLKVHTSFRNGLRQLNDGGNAKIVERRKLAAEYLRFVKSSQRFFRGYIRSLSVVFGGIPKLQRLANKFSHDDLLLSRNNLITHSSPTNDQILRSCFRTLVQLGDLSRYRESELAKKEPNWSHAVGFYDLARAVLPVSGISYNQLAIVALADNNLFRAIYWIYRALSTEEPHPQADANLKRAFLKISQADGSEKLRSPCSKLTNTYLTTISKAYSKAAFADLPEIENNVILALNAELQLARPSTYLRKLVLINFAATEHAQIQFTKVKGAGNSYNTFIAILRLTIRCTYEVVSVAKERLLVHFQSCYSTSGEAAATALIKKVSTIICLVRLSVLWSIKNIVVLINEFNTEITELQSRLWKLFADCLTLLKTALPSSVEPDLQYMLVEDEDTVAFLPLICDQTKFVWLYPNGMYKSVWHDVADRAGEDTEVLHRINQCVRIGMDLSRDKEVPIDFDVASGLFKNRKAAVPEEIRKVVTRNLAYYKKSDTGACEEFEAERMVSDLVEDSNDALLDLNKSPAASPQTQILSNGKLEQNEAGSRVNLTGIASSVSMTTRDGPPPEKYSSPSNKKRSPGTPSLRPSHVPMSRTISNHSRALSNDSAASWTAGRPWSAVKPYTSTNPEQTTGRRSSLGPAMVTAEGTPETPTADSGMSSSMLFGAGQSPWSMSQPESKRLSEAHERINSSPRLMPKPLSPPNRQQPSGPGASAWNDAEPSNVDAGSTVPGPSTPLKWNVHAKPFK